MILKFYEAQKSRIRMRSLAATVLCLAPESGEWIIVFRRNFGFEIASYGDGGIWQQLAKILKKE